MNRGVNKTRSVVRYICRACQLGSRVQRPAQGKSAFFSDRRRDQAYGDPDLGQDPSEPSSSPSRA